MSLPGLPNELLQAIALYCGVEGGGIARANRRLRDNANDILWQSAIKDPVTFTKIILGAAESGNIRMMKKAAAHGADFDLIHPVRWPQNMAEFDSVTDDPDWEEGEELSQFWASPLHLAVYHNHYDTVEWLITVQGVDVDAPGRLICGCRGFADRNLRAGNVFEHYQIWTALHFAVCRKHDSIAHLLLSRNATTSVMLPADVMEDSHVISRCVEALRNGYTYGPTGDTQKMTALHVAALHGTKPLVTHLVQAQGMDINESDVNSQGWIDYRPIHYATLSQDETMIEHLISLGADLNGANADWSNVEYTLLFWVARHEKLEGLFKLLDAGAKTWLNDGQERKAVLSNEQLLLAIEEFTGIEKWMAAMVKVMDKTLQDYASDSSLCLPIESEMRKALEILSQDAPRDWDPSTAFSQTAKRLLRSVFASMTNENSPHYLIFDNMDRREKAFANRVWDWKCRLNKEEREHIGW